MAINGNNNANNLPGTNLADEIFGKGGNDTLRGMGGDDLLDGGAGNDLMQGGAGNDTYVVDAAGDKISGETSGLDTVLASISYTLGAGLERLTLQGTATKGTGNGLNNQIIGNGQHNTLSGLGGDDVLIGGAGRDTTIGGNGNDVHVVDNRRDVVVEEDGGGTDSIDSIVSWTLDDFIENLVLTGSADVNATGNELDNLLLGNDGDNELRGGAGRDEIDGGRGSDDVYGGAGGDKLTWDAYDAVVAAGGGLDTLAVGAHHDSVVLDGNPAGRIRDIEKVDLGAAETAASLVLTEEGVVGLSVTSNTLLVKGDAGDGVTLRGEWTRGTDVVNPQGETGTYASWRSGDARVLIEADLSVHTGSMSLSALDGANGFRIEGGESVGVAMAVASAGDVDGDGLDDPFVHNIDNADVIFSPASGFSSSFAFAPDGTNGIHFSNPDGPFNEEESWSGAGVGDFNGDGFADVVVDGRSSSDGTHGVVFGGAGASSLFIFGLDYGSRGIVLQGTNGYGHSVAAAGDINGDGFDDVLVGNYLYAGSTLDPSKTTVVFGGADVPGSVNITNPDGSDAFTLHGGGVSVASAGDINGDGLADIIIGWYRHESNGVAYSGEAYVIFGKDSPFAASKSLFTIDDGVQGFRLDGIGENDRAGRSVASAGDVNGDGYSDVIVGAYGAGGGAGRSYVVFGKASGWSADMSLSALNGKNGFRLDGVEAGDESGCSVASAGDINGDGYDDVLVGARGANGEAGATYVVYGKQKGFDAAISLADLDGGDGFRIDGIDAGDASGFSVASAGDVNGDGYADLMIGAPVSGDAYVIYGGNFTGAVDFVGSGGDDLLDYGSDAGESFVAGRGNDTMVGGGGRDVYRGGAGDDRIVIGDADFLKVDGGGNEDTLAVSGELDLDLTEILNTRITGIEIIDLVAGAGENDLNLTKLDLFALSNTNANVITVNGDASDSVTIDGLWAEAPELDGGYRVFTSGAATLRVQSQIDILGIDVIT